MYKNDFSKLSQFFCFCVTPMYDVVFYTKEIKVEIGNFFFIFVCFILILLPPLHKNYTKVKI